MWDNPRWSRLARFPCILRTARYVIKKAHRQEVLALAVDVYVGYRAALRGKEMTYTWHLEI